MQALSGRAFESVRHLIDDSDWLEAADNGERLLGLLAKPEYYGKEELESLYQSMHKLFYSDLRKSDDDLPAFRSKFEQAVRKIRKHKVELPPEALGFLFLKQAKISSESFERLITLTNGDLKFDAVVDGLRRLKMKLLDGDEQVLSKQKHLWVQESMDDDPQGAPLEPQSDGDDMELIEQALADLDGDGAAQSQSQELTEDGAREVLMTLIKQKINKPVNMSYRQVQHQKREVKNARGYRPVLVNSLSRTIGFEKFSPNMQRVIRHVMRVFPSGFASHENRAQPLESRNSSGHAAVNDCAVQHFETFHYCTHESYAVVDTGCQKSAIGRRTLENIASRLPSELSIKFDKKQYRFTGIGGETVTDYVALIPVCFGQRPGMIRAAVLEDTPDAPFLLSLPILKALNTSMHLSQQSMCFQDIYQVGKMFYNEKGQLCPKLFEFDAISQDPNDSPDRWHVHKIIGDECQVFMLQEPPEDVSSRVNKRACTTHVEAQPKYVSTWMRMCNKLKIQDHLDSMVKLTMGLAIPLMYVLSRVLAMMMRVADMEEIDTLQEMMNDMVMAKKKQEKGMKVSKKESEFVPKPRKSSKSSSLGSFSVVSAETLETLGSHRSQDQPSSSNQGRRPKDPEILQCYCGLTPVKYTCRKQGHNYPAILQVPEGASVPASVPLFCLDSRDQRGTIRKDVCSIPGDQDFSKHTNEVKEALRRKIFLMQRSRKGFHESFEPNCQRKSSRIQISTSGVRPSLEQEGNQRLCEDQNMRQELLRLKLIGGVFSPNRFVERSSKHGLRPGQAFDLRLGHQFLCAKQRRKCIEHIMNNPYELVVVTPPCTLFSLLQYLGLGKSKESCMNDPEFQRRYHEACVLLNFAALICTIQVRRNQFFLFEQPWTALSWHEKCIQRLLNAPGTMLVRTDQCMFGQKDLKQRPIRKRTGFLTNNAKIASALRRTCKNNHVHQPCVGQSKGQSRAAQAARYPVALIDAVLRAFAKSNHGRDDLRDVQVSSIHWTQPCPDGTTKDVKYTHTFRASNHDVHGNCQDVCANAMVVDPTERQVQFVSEPSFDQFAVQAVQDTANVDASSHHQPLTEEEYQAVELLSPDQRRSIRNELTRAHRGMGHPNHDRFLRILRLGGASLATLGLAKTFECPQCKENS
eukprot:s1685_g10.t1